MSIKSLAGVALLLAVSYGARADDAAINTTVPTQTAATHSNNAALSSYNLADHLSGSADIVSNYVWRGISQTNNSAAPQAGLTYTADSGFYASLWGSSVNFKNGSGATTELDYVAGFKQALTDDLSINIFGVRYNYPRTTGLDYNEYALQGSYKIVTATVAYSNNEFNVGHSGEYYNLAVDYPVPSQYFFDIAGVSAGRFELPAAAGYSYNDYKVYISKTLTKNIKLSLNFTDTNGENRTYPADKAHLFLDLSASF